VQVVNAVAREQLLAALTELKKPKKEIAKWPQKADIQASPVAITCRRIEVALESGAISSLHDRPGSLGAI